MGRKEMMPTKFDQLSSYEQFRVFRFLTKGETANDPGLAAITLEAAEHFRSQSRAKAGIFRWAPIVMAVILVVAVLPDVIKGQVGMVFFLLFIALCAVANLMLNPWIRPKNVAKSAEASRQVISPVGRDRAMGSSFTA